MIADTKEYILHKAFETFLVKGYDSTSMTVLQQEFKMSRGAMYRYFASKDDLFKAVIDRYFFGLIDRFNPAYKEEITVEDMISLHLKNLKAIIEYLSKIDGLDVFFLNYAALSIQAAKRYPGFLERIDSYKGAQLKAWQIAIENSIKKGDVREDVNVKLTAALFVKAYSTSDADRPTKNLSRLLEDSKKIMNYLYSLIKK